MSLLVHIHKQGVFGRLIIDKKRAGYKIIVVNETLTYDRPKVATWTAPNEIILEPGDEITATCGFASMDKKEWSFFGSQTSDEMCFFFIDIYPRPQQMNYLFLPGYGSIDYCTAYDGEMPWSIGKCVTTSFYKKLDLRIGMSGERSNTTMEMVDSCTCHGPENYPTKSCSSKCHAFMSKTDMFNEPCLEDEAIFQLIMQPFFDEAEVAIRVRSQMIQCQEQSPPPTGQVCTAIGTGGNGGESRIYNVNNLLIALMFYCLSTVYFLIVM